MSVQIKQTFENNSRTNRKRPHEIPVEMERARSSAEEHLLFCTAKVELHRSLTAAAFVPPRIFPYFSMFLPMPLAPVSKDKNSIKII